MSYDSAKSVSGFVKRLKSFTDESRTLYAFQQRTGFAKNTIKGYLEGAEPGRVRLALLAERLGVTPEWLAYGVGEKDHPTKHGWIQLPELVAKREPGSDKLQITKEAPRMMVKVDVLDRSFQGAPADQIVAFRMPDTSLAPILLKDEWTLVDQSNRDPRHGGLFCVAYEGVLTIRHIGLAGPGRIRISAENKKVSTPVEYPLSEKGLTFDVIGEAIIGNVRLNPARTRSRLG